MSDFESYGFRADTSASGRPGTVVAGAVKKQPNAPATTSQPAATQQRQVDTSMFVPGETHNEKLVYLKTVREYLVIQLGQVEAAIDAIHANQ